MMSRMELPNQRALMWLTCILAVIASSCFGQPKVRQDEKITEGLYDHHPVTEAETFMAEKFRQLDDYQTAIATYAPTSNLLNGANDNERLVVRYYRAYLAKYLEEVEKKSHRRFGRQKRGNEDRTKAHEHATQTGAAALSATIAWRSTNDIDNAVIGFKADEEVNNVPINEAEDNSKWQFNQIDEIKAAFPMGFHKHDKAGRPVCIHRIGEMDIKAMSALFKDGQNSNAKSSTFHNLQMKQAEFVQRVLFPRASTAGNVIDRQVLIYDMGGEKCGISSLLANREFLVSVFEPVAVSLKAHYPETVQYILIVNLPGILRNLLKFSMKWADEKTQAKVHFVDPSKLTEFIDPENLPKFLGGKDETEFLKSQDELDFQQQCSQTVSLQV